MTSELQNMQQKPIVDFRKFLQERFDKTSPRRQLAKDETTKLAKLEGIAEKLKRGENVQNRQLQIWLSEDEYAKVDIEWQEQLELRVLKVGAGYEKFGLGGKWLLHGTSLTKFGRTMNLVVMQRPLVTFRREKKRAIRIL
jgi:hypothetical protein